MNPWVKDVYWTNLLYRQVTGSASGDAITIVRERARGVVALAVKLWQVVLVLGFAFSVGDIVRLLWLNHPYKGQPHARSDPSLWFALALLLLADTYFLHLFRAEVLYGPEIVIVDDLKLRVTTRLGSRIKTSAWDLTEISGFRVAANWIGMGQTVYSLRFDHAGKTVSLLPPANLESTQKIFEQIRSYTVGDD